MEYFDFFFSLSACLNIFIANEIKLRRIILGILFRICIDEETKKKNSFYVFFAWKKKKHQCNFKVDFYLFFYFLNLFFIDSIFIFIDEYYSRMCMNYLA